MSFSPSLRFFLFLLISLAWALTACATPSQIEPSHRILVFTKTARFRHESIPAGVAALTELGAQNHFRVESTEDTHDFTDARLHDIDAVVFLSTTGQVLDPAAKAALQRYIQAGGGFVGIHSASATEYGWPWYNHLVGAYLLNHPLNPGVRPGVITIVDHDFLATAGLPNRWARSDEWYNFKSIYPGLHVVAELDESSYEGGTEGTHHPIAWYHNFDGGRAFYTALGHEVSSYSEPLFRKHLLGGILYAIGDGHRDYSRATAVEEPEEGRFIKTVLADKLHQPMELAIAHDGRIFFTELATGRLLEYTPKTSALRVVHQFSVSTVGGTGVIGVALDPHFDANHFLYLYYAPPKEDEPILFRLSRFTLGGNDEFDAASEKVLLEVPVQKQSGSHHGGSLAWDRSGNLYLSTGDSSSPAPSEGYAPLDERPGHSSLDSQRSAANTNDFKGKILRIHPEPDGTYAIPAGNLFPVGEAKTRPEIYVMGVRNPYRIAVNPKTSVLYWGEPGPDAGEDSERGPRGYDEFNQAKQAGNFGWPYFVANNLAYSKWNFATRTAGPRMDPRAPENHSPNNTGLANLPPAQAAFIWYPYGPSEKFPEFGQGGRCAIAGDFYSYDASNPSSRKFPVYFDGQLFVADWMRNWVFSLRFDGHDNYLGDHAFMSSNGDFRRPIDLAFGPDGAMYMLEYGSVYGFDNVDARLVRIEYDAGKRAPIARAGAIDQAGEVARKIFNQQIHLTSEEDRTMRTHRMLVGAVPLTATFTGVGSESLDEDDRTLRYFWKFSDDGSTSEDPTPRHTFKTPGNYQVTLRVRSAEGMESSDTVAVHAGNTRPEIELETKDNRSFFWPGKAFHYQVKVRDREDGEDLVAKVLAQTSRGPEPFVIETGEAARSTADAALMASPLIAASDCRACHTPETRSVGPAFRQVADKYRNDQTVRDRLARKIITGGVGNWGEVAMIAHPQLSVADASAIVDSILALAQPNANAVELPRQGEYLIQSTGDKPSIGSAILTASYADHGANGEPALGVEISAFFRSATMPAAYADEHVGFERFRDNLSSGGEKAYLSFKHIDLTGLKSVTLGYSSLDSSGNIEVRLDSFVGPIVARGDFSPTGDWQKFSTVRMPLGLASNGYHSLYFIVRKPTEPNTKVIQFSRISFNQD
jgi:cytochrome c